MKRLLNHPLFLLTVLSLLGYGIAELIIRGDALNKISFGIAGTLLWCGVALLIVCWIIVPIFSFTLFPQWIEPETITDPGKQLDFLERYGKFLLHQYRENTPLEITGEICELRTTCKTLRDDPARCRAELLRLIPEIHQKLSDEIGGRIIRDYMKKTAIIVAISQRGWIDSTVMLVMQVRMIIDLSKAMGYRPSWYFLLSTLGWVFINSILFALFDGTEIVNDAVEGLLPVVAGETFSKSVSIFGKAANIAVQALSSMALIWATGKVVQMRLLGNAKRLSGKERIACRLEGYRKAWQMRKQFFQKNEFFMEEE